MRPRAAKTKKMKGNTTWSSLAVKKEKFVASCQHKEASLFHPADSWKRLSAPQTLSFSRRPPSAGTRSLIGRAAERNSAWRFLLAVGRVNHQADRIRRAMTIDSAFSALRGIHWKQQSPRWRGGKQIGSAERQRRLSRHSPANAFDCVSLRNSPYTDTHSTFTSSASAPPCFADPNKDRVCLTKGLTPPQ